MKRAIVVVVFVLVGVLAAILLAGCGGLASIPVWQNPDVIAAREQTTQTEIRESGQTERTEIRESERTAREEATAERALQMRLMQQEQDNHRETMFRLYSLALIASGYDNMVWIVVAGTVGGIAGYVVHSKINESPKARKKHRKELRKLVRLLWDELVDSLTADPILP